MFVLLSGVFSIKVWSESVGNIPALIALTVEPNKTYVYDTCILFLDMYSTYTSSYAYFIWRTRTDRTNYMFITSYQKETEKN